MNGAPLLDVSVVVPIYNDGGTLSELVARIDTVLGNSPYSYEIIIVDDGSSDRTPFELSRLSKHYDSVKGLRLARNFGQEPAVQAGMLRSVGRWIVQLDGDLQHPPEELPKLLEKAAEGYEIVYGIRQHRIDPIHRVLLSRALCWIMRRGFGIELPEDISTFRVIDGDLARFIAALPERRKFFSALANWVGANAASIPVAHHARARGKSRYDIFKLVGHSLDLMAGFSVRPLRIIGVVGVVFALLGIGYACVKITQKLAGVEIQMGYTSVFSAVVIVGGVNLFALSVIGEYVGRIFLEAQRRPLYRIAEEYGMDTPLGLRHRGDHEPASERRVGGEGARR